MTSDFPESEKRNQTIENALKSARSDVKLDLMLVSWMMSLFRNQLTKPFPQQIKFLE